MKISKLTLLFLLVASTAFFACKKEEITTQTAVQRQIIGKWYIKYDFRTTYINGLEVGFRPDTVKKYDPIDTLVFNADGSLIRRNKVVISTTTYAVAADGESISYGTKPDSVKKISAITVHTLGLLSKETTSGTSKTIITTQLYRN